jgi:hypothetical protein
MGWTIGVRSLTGAEDFSSSPCVQTGSEAHPAHYPMGTGGPFPGSKARPGRNADHSPPSSAEVKNEQELYLLSPHVPPRHVSGSLYILPFTSVIKYYPYSLHKIRTRMTFFGLLVIKHVTSQAAYVRGIYVTLAYSRYDAVTTFISYISFIKYKMDTTFRPSLINFPNISVIPHKRFNRGYYCIIIKL